uniref:Uncharacterized protein n=1 Tax=Poecilia formosa TaxID=48698 RepID=A0A087YRS4_POEFO
MQERSGTTISPGGLQTTVRTSHSVLMMTSTSQRLRAPSHNSQLLGPRPLRFSRESQSACITKQARQPENSTPNKNLRAAQLVE